MNAMTTANTTSQHMRSVDLDQFTGTVSKDMKQWARDRQALFAPLLLPIVLMFIATVLFGFGGDQWNIGLVDKSGGSYAASLTQAVENSESNITPYFNIVTRDQDEAQRLVEDGRLHLVITIPEGFDQVIANGQTPTLETSVYNINTDMMKNARLRLYRVIQDWGAELGRSPITIDQITTRPDDIWRRSFIGGSAVVLAIMVGAALNSALIIAREWEHRTAKELQLAPRARTGIIAGKIVAGLLAGMVSTAITLLFATTIFGLRIPPERIPMLLLYAGLVAIGFAGLGIAVGAWLKDYRAVQPLILVTLAGSFFAAGGFSSVPTLPAGVRAFDQYWPPSWAFEIINNHTFMATPPDPTQPLILLGLLSVAGVAVGAMAARRQL